MLPLYQPALSIVISLLGQDDFKRKRPKLDGALHLSNLILPRTSRPGDAAVVSVCVAREKAT